MERWLITVGLAISVLVAVVVAAGYLAPMQVVGRIAPAFKSLPADYGLHAEVVSFQSLDGIDLKGWWIPAQGTARATERLAVRVLPAVPYSGEREQHAVIDFKQYGCFVFPVRIHS